jgi:hypothetical protein
MTIVGVDVSSKRIDLAWLENGKPCRWHQELAKGHLIDRLRSIEIRWPVAIAWPATGRRDDVTDIAIEYPFGRGNAIAALMAVTGIVTRQAPPWARVAWPSAGELRAAINANNTKTDAHTVLHATALLNQWPISTWNEHELDALVACTGWTRILEAQE